MWFHNFRNLLHRAISYYARCSSFSDVAMVTAICCVAPFRKFLDMDFFSNVEMKLYGAHNTRKLRQYEDDNCYNFNGIYMPRFHPTEYSLTHSLYHSVSDVLFAYLYNDDKYDKAFVAKSDWMTSEGVYCYQDGEIDLTVKKGDVVLDLGSCFGEFAAYAAKKGAACYAFEPLMQNRTILQKTVELNHDVEGKIVIVPYGVDAESGIKFVAESAFTDSTQLADDAPNGESSEGLEKVETVTLDEWVAKERVKVDFIKADIEGYERRMLAGATELLKTQHPILSLCTYHLPDDPKVMRDIILNANPRYKIIQRRMKMLAYVPE